MFFGDRVEKGQRGVLKDGREVLHRKPVITMDIIISCAFPLGQEIAEGPGNCVKLMNVDQISETSPAPNL